ncbi:small integral membrane protein 8 [Ceratina calcarata]|uniref:Small integral membrane protein 8 n=1 Tax=Ceratina calcarata TaxID=156304 RepID=A0AAJ7WEZ1_9HYME|nr:small integral membrane protein 8 [Ceratina calcarata]
MNDKEKPETKPGDGLRSLKSTMLFRAVNYELYARPNKAVMIAGGIVMLGCIGYLVYMRQNPENVKYYSAAAAAAAAAAATGTDGTVNVKKKTSRWTD